MVENYPYTDKVMSSVPDLLEFRKGTVKKRQKKRDAKNLK